MLLADKSGNSAVNVLCLNGVAGNWGSMPDVAALAGATELDVKIRLMPTATYPATPQEFCGQYLSAGNQRAFYFGQGYFAANNLHIQLSGDGITGQVIGSTANLPAGYRGSDLTACWYRFTWRASDQRVQFFYAPDSATVPSSWTQSGTNVTLPGSVASLFNSTTLFGVGGITNQGANENPAGNYYYCSVATTIGGANAVEIDFTQAAKLAGTFTATTGQTVTINTTGATGARICGARDLYQGVVANQPVYLPWAGSNYGYLNGVAGNYFSTPDSAALSITGDIDVRAYVALADWTPAATQTIIAKYDTGANKRSYFFGVLTDGKLQFNTSPDGTNVVTTSSTVATAISDFGAKWVRAIRDVDSGAGTNITRFYLSDDGSTWTQLGTDVGNAGTTSIYDSDVILNVGAALNSGVSSSLAIGNFSRAQIYNGIAGTLVFDFNPSAYTSGTTFPDSAGGATITLNGGSTIVTRTCLYFDGSNDYLKSPAFALAQPETVYFVGSQVGWTANDFILDGAATNNSGALKQVTATPQYFAYAGGTGSLTNSDFAVGTNAIVSVVFNGANSSNRVNRLAAVTGSSGDAVRSMNGIVLGASSDGSAPSNITVSELLVYAAAHGRSFQDRVIMWLLRKWGIVG